MRGLAETDRVLPISPDAGKQLQAFWEREGINPHAHVKTCWIPGELTASVRATTPAAAPDAVNRAYPVRFDTRTAQEPQSAA